MKTSVSPQRSDRAPVSSALTEQVASAEERMRKRRQQLAERLASMRSGETHDADTTDSAKDQVSASQQQIQQAIAAMEDHRVEALNKLTAIRDNVANTAVQREEVMADLKNTLIAAHQSQAEETARLHGAVQLRGSASHDLKVPQDLHAELEKQRDACAAILASHDAVISRLQEELHRKDGEFVVALRKQAAELSGMMSNIRSQVRTTSEMHKSEVDSIEETLTREYNELIATSRGELEGAVEHRRLKQKEFQRARAELVADAHMASSNLQDEYAEEHMQLKRELQFEVFSLEQQLEEMRALYQLNGERLDYNLRVLSVRVRENERAIQLHKRRLARLQDGYSNLIARRAEVERRLHSEHSVLGEGLKRLAEKYAHLQTKFRYFERADAERHHRVWQLHVEESLTLLRRCLAADQVIHEHILRLEWLPPDMSSLDQLAQNAPPGVLPAVMSVGEVESLDSDLTDAAIRALPHIVVGGLALILRQCSFLDVAPGSSETVAGLLEAPASSSLDLSAEEGSAPAGSDLDLVLASKQKLVRILQAIDVNSVAEVERMISSFFVVSAADENPGAAAGDQDGNEVDTVTFEPKLVSPVDIVAALKTYMEFRTSPTRGVAQLMSHPPRKVIEDAGRQFWKQLESAVPDSSNRRWKQCRLALEKYLQLLRRRSSLIDETDALRLQNDELRKLLNTYLTGDAVHALISPPQLALALGGPGGAAVPPLLDSQHPGAAPAASTTLAIEGPTSVS